MEVCPLSARCARTVCVKCEVSDDFNYRITRMELILVCNDANLLHSLTHAINGISAMTLIFFTTPLCAVVRTDAELKPH